MSDIVTDSNNLVVGTHTELGRVRGFIFTLYYIITKKLITLLNANLGFESLMNCKRLIYARNNILIEGCIASLDKFSDNLRTIHSLWYFEKKTKNIWMTS